ncbi:MAG TPA: hypothetical protein VFN75_12185 [Pseudonocardiaceae bacterium]|nr:hypothetical protein [Pseudonocardiaceae bacterium]
MSEHVGDTAARVDSGQQSGIELSNLLIDLESLVILLSAEVGAASNLGHLDAYPSTLDAFLFAAAMGQIVEDFECEPMPALAKIAQYTKQPIGTSSNFGPLRRLDLVTNALSFGGAAYRACRWPGIEHLACRIRRVTTTLATLILTGGGSDPAQNPSPRLVTECAEIADCVDHLPLQLRRRCLRLPDCYRSFDQRPEDAVEFALRIADESPELDRPILVVGVRTSGSYLAPVQAAALTRVGFRSVAWCSHRPGHRLTPYAKDQLAAARTQRGMVLLVDDPPVTGGKLAGTARELEAVGISRADTVLLLPVFGGPGSVPGRLRAWNRVVLPWREWAVHGELQPAVLLESVSKLLPGRRVRSSDVRAPRVVEKVLTVEKTEPSPIPQVLNRPLVRSHLRTVVRATVRCTDGSHETVPIYVKGCGLGFLGRHTLAVGSRLGEYVPEVYGMENGILFRQALEEESRLRDIDDREARSVSEAVVDYAVARAHRLPVPSDPARSLRRRGALWEFAADVITECLPGPLRICAGPLARRAARTILPSLHPSIVDGSTHLGNWFEHQGRWVKVDYDERAFSVWEHFTFDAAWDVAGAAASYLLGPLSPNDRDHLDRAMRRRFEEATGERLSPERWALLQLLHIRSWRHHLSRLLGQGPGQLQTHGGGPPEDPAIDEAGFREDLLSNIEACDRAASRVRGTYVAEVVIGMPPTELSASVCVIPAEFLIQPEMQREATLSWSGARLARILLKHGFQIALLAGEGSQETGWWATRIGASRVYSCADSRPEGSITVSDPSDLVRLVGHSWEGCPVCDLSRPGWSTTLITASLGLVPQRRLRRVGRLLLALARSVPSG